MVIHNSLYILPDFYSKAILCHPNKIKYEGQGRWDTKYLTIYKSKSCEFGSQYFAAKALVGHSDPKLL